MNKLTSLTTIENKTILVRVDLNVPVDDDGNITDNTRLIETLPTIKCLQEKGGKIVLISHFGRPKPIYDNNGNIIDEELYQKQINNPKHINMFQNIIIAYLDNNIIVKKIKKCIGDEVIDEINNMKQKDIILLENVRYYVGETENNPLFSENLSKGIDIFVMDAFGTSHRKHSSTYGVKDYVNINVMGLLMEKEIKYLDLIMESSEKKITAIIGGSKVSSKFDVLTSMIKRCNKIIIGGGMANTFLKARGYDVGKSLVEDDLLDKVKLLEEEAKSIGVELLLPIDLVTANEFSQNALVRIINIGEKCSDMMILDVGLKSINQFKEHLQSSDIIVWNGPLGVFEIDIFSHGTKEIALLLSQLAETKTVIAGGGDSIAAINKYELADKFTHISTGGGAMLEYLEGRF
tara:strand:+ start:1589 stop:2803 length:1215 start_codon:yes stop_codon:yes gene_type:complete